MRLISLINLNNDSRNSKKNGKYMGGVVIRAIGRQQVIQAANKCYHMQEPGY